VSTNLRRIGEKARKEPKLVFTSLYHHVTDVDNLRACYDALPANRAVGVDGVTKEKYGKNLEENLLDLSGRMKRMGYRPQVKRRSYIPKAGSEKGRLLGISCFEDKIVELAVKRVLELIYEVEFLGSSYGYRLEGSQHKCLDVLGRTIQQEKINYVVEADITSFFDEVCGSGTRPGSISGARRISFASPMTFLRVFSTGMMPRHSEASCRTD
jgi:RNA-directed DNA polymerase